MRHRMRHDSSRVPKGIANEKVKRTIKGRRDRLIVWVNSPASESHYPCMARGLAVFT